MLAQDTEAVIVNAASALGLVSIVGLAPSQVAETAILQEQFYILTHA